MLRAVRHEVEKQAKMLAEKINAGNLARMPRREERGCVKGDNKGKPVRIVGDVERNDQFG